MAGQVINGNGHVFDQDTGAWIGVLDNKGNVQGVPAARLTEQQVQASVSGGVQLTAAAAIADTGPRDHLTPGRITDGDEIGTPVVWWSPSGSGGFWGYEISPTDKFGA